MKSLNPRPARPRVPAAPAGPRRRPRTARTIVNACVALFALALLVAASSSSASLLTARPSLGGIQPSLRPHQSSTEAVRTPGRAASAAPLSPFAAAPLFDPQREDDVATYNEDCTTPQTAFELGDIVCVKATNAVVGSSDYFPVIPLRKFSVVNPGGLEIGVAVIDATEDSFSFTLPEDRTTAYGNTTIDNRGEWRANINTLSENFQRSSVAFTVREPNNPAVDLSVINTPEQGGDGITAGAQAPFVVIVENKGPDDADDVTLSFPVPDFTSFFGLTQADGPAFDCQSPSVGTGPSGNAVCSIESLPAGAKATFTAIYLSGTGAAVGSDITSTATVESTTTERHAPDNTSSSSYRVAREAPCTITTPSDISVNAPSGASGMNVTYGAATGTAGCGAITCDPPSGSFFPLGDTFVTCTSTLDTLERFKVTVNDVQPPLITCPADFTVLETTPGSGSAIVNFPAPTVTDNDPNIQITYNPPSGLPLDIGTHEVEVTATDVSGNSASCRFNVTVNPRPGACTITPDVANLPTISGDCSVSVSTIPTATDTCFGKIGATTNDPRFYDEPGTHTVRWNYTNADGSTVTQNQTVVVTAGSGTLSVTGPPLVEVHNPAGSPSCAVSIADLAATLGTNVGGSCSNYDLDFNVSPAAPGNLFQVGTVYTVVTTVTTATSSANVTQTLRVVDDTPPSVSAPADAAYECISAVPAASASQATAADNCGTPTVTVTETNNGGASSAASPLVITRTYTATDSTGRTASDQQVITVIDSTPPAISAPADKTVNADPVSCSVNGASVALGSPVVTDNCNTTVTNNAPAVYPLGETVVTWTARDEAGNTRTASQKVTVVDVTAPAISCPTDIVVTLPPNTSAVSMPVSFPSATATDACDSSPTIAMSHASGSVFPVGTTVVTATATDDAGNVSSCTFNVTVHYLFSGFFSPVDNPPTLNQVNAGRAIPVKFSLSGNKGLAIFAADSPTSQQVNCSTSAPVSDVEETLTAGSSSLSYDASSDRYNYVWKTNSAWAGTCRQLNVRLNDGTDHTALFKFK